MSMNFKVEGEKDKEKVADELDEVVDEYEEFEEVETSSSSSSKSDDKKGLVHLTGKHVIQRRSGHQWEGQVDSRNQAGTEHVDGKQLLMVLEIAQKDHQRGSRLKIFCSHNLSSCTLPIIIQDFLKNCKLYRFNFP